MLARAATLTMGLIGGAGFSQFPEYSQQYIQRLGGAVDELGRQISREEADAAKLGLDVEDRVESLRSGNEAAVQEADNLEADRARYAKLSEALQKLEGAGPFTRAQLASHMVDPEIAARAFESYKPAVPATFEGAVFAGTGFVFGAAALALVIGFLRRLFTPFRRRSRRSRY